MMILERAALFIWITESGSVSLFMFALFHFLRFLFSRLCLSFCGALEGSGKEKDAVCQMFFVFWDRESPFIASFAFVVRLALPPTSNAMRETRTPPESNVSLT